MCPIARSTEVVCSLHRNKLKTEPEGKVFVLFPDAFPFCSVQLYSSTLFSIPLSGNGNSPGDALVIPSVAGGRQILVLNR